VFFSERDVAAGCWLSQPATEIEAIVKINMPAFMGPHIHL
jgi:hypothetical protein